MNIKMSKFSKFPVTDEIRFLFGFVFGFFVMLMIVRVFIVNDFDYLNMQRGVRLILSGENPWAVETRIENFYNPPFSILFLWPMVFASPSMYIIIGGALLFGYLFYLQAWVAFSWFLTNTFLWLVAAGGIDMFVVGGGLLLLSMGDKSLNEWQSLFLRVLAYGLLMVKPQGTVFIVLLYILMRRDWKGILISIIIYGLPFLNLYVDWIRVIITDPPLAQNVAAHSIWAKFGPIPALFLAFLVVISRRWKYWQLGGALAGILAPYGMPGLPILLTLTSVKKIRSVLVVVIFSGYLASLTWINPPESVDFYAYSNPLMSIYHLSMLGLVISLASVSDCTDDFDTIGFIDWVKNRQNPRH